MQYLDVVKSSWPAFWVWGIVLPLLAFLDSVLGLKCCITCAGPSGQCPGSEVLYNLYWPFWTVSWEWSIVSPVLAFLDSVLGLVFYLSPVLALLDSVLGLCCCITCAGPYGQCPGSGTLYHLCWLFWTLSGDWGVVSPVLALWDSVLGLVLYHLCWTFWTVSWVWGIVSPVLALTDSVLGLKCCIACAGPSGQCPGFEVLYHMYWSFWTVSWIWGVVSPVLALLDSMRGGMSILSPVPVLPDIVIITLHGMWCQNVIIELSDGPFLVAPDKVCRFHNTRRCMDTHLDLFHAYQ